MVRRGLVESRTLARQLVEDGKVLVGGSVALKPARMVDAGEPVVLAGEKPRFVSRGGDKLVGALEAFDLDPAGLVVLDAGASTGGFTDCLLQNGARAVTALDVGHGQLHEVVRGDARVRVVERTNLRHVTPEDFGLFDAVVADLSFISLRTVMPNLVGCCRDGGFLVLLVKPQFEVGREDASKGRGVVTDPVLWRTVLDQVAESAVAAGAGVQGCVPSPITGGDGNVEFLLHLVRGAHSTGGSVLLDAAVAAATAAHQPENAARPAEVEL
jgi:23S rRNA (cytidine1920-2'-O)/16S rRNA (cytidine1409-2'-O)-methyltransferase